MNAFFLMTAVQKGAKRIPMGLVVAGAIFLHHNATALPTMVNLGTASSFAVLAGSTITDAGGASTIITGDVGLYPGTAIGLTAGQVPGGTIYAAGTGSDTLLIGATTDLTTAYNDAKGRSVDSTVGTELGGTTRTPGVYDSASGTFGITGTLTLNGDGVFIFKMATTLITAAGAPGNPGSSVVLENGAQACHVFWQVGSSATIGTYSDFVGNILAYQDITLDPGATVDGRVLAGASSVPTDDGAVTLNNNTITKSVCTGGKAVPDSGSTLLLLSSGLATLLAFKPRPIFAAFTQR
jgi:hypothetical protein